MGKKKDECRTENLGTEQSQKGRLDSDLSRQSINNPGQRNDNSHRTDNDQRTERTGRSNEETVDENSEDLP